MALSQARTGRWVARLPWAATLAERIGEFTRRAWIRPNYRGLRRKFHPADRLEIAVPDLLLVGLRHVDALEDPQCFAGVHRAFFRIERAIGGKHDLVEVVEGEPRMGRRHAAEHRGVSVERVLEVI